MSQLRSSTASRCHSTHTGCAPQHRAGMTLIELIVGIVVTGLIVSAGYAAFATIIDQRHRAVQVAQETAHAVELHRTLLHWLDGAVAVQQGSPASFLTPTMIDAVTFVTTTKTPLGTTGSLITLYTSSGSAGSGRGLFALMFPNPSSSPIVLQQTTNLIPRDSLRILLDPTIRQMSIEYLFSNNGTRQWQPQDTYIYGTNKTPLAIRLRLTSDDPTVMTTFSQPIVAPLMGRP